jgi:hypothetical protein
MTALNGDSIFLLLCLRVEKNNLTTKRTKTRRKEPAFGPLHPTGSAFVLFVCFVVVLYLKPGDGIHPILQFRIKFVCFVVIAFTPAKKKPRIPGDLRLFCCFDVLSDLPNRFNLRAHRTAPLHNSQRAHSGQSFNVRSGCHASEFAAARAALSM